MRATAAWGAGIRAWAIRAWGAADLPWASVWTVAIWARRTGAAAASGQGVMRADLEAWGDPPGTPAIALEWGVRGARRDDRNRGARVVLGKRRQRRPHRPRLQRRSRRNPS